MALVSGTHSESYARTSFWTVLNIPTIVAQPGGSAEDGQSRARTNGLVGSILSQKSIDTKHEQAIRPRGRFQP